MIRGIYFVLGAFLILGGCSIPLRVQVFNESGVEIALVHYLNSRSEIEVVSSGGAYKYSIGNERSIAIRVMNVDYVYGANGGFRRYIYLESGYLNPKYVDKNDSFSVCLLPGFSLRLLQVGQDCSTKIEYDRVLNPTFFPV